LLDDLILDSNPLLPLAGLRFSEIALHHPGIAQSFLAYELTTVRIVTEEESRISAMFVRLNTSTALTGAEIRNAREGEGPRIIRKIANHPFFSSKIRFQVQRGQDRNVAGKLLLIEFAGHFSDTKKTQLDRLVVDAARADTALHDLERAEERVLRVLGRMCEIFVDRDPLLRSQGPVSLYYWLARETQGEDPTAIREFLLGFDREVQETRALIRQQSQELVNPELALYISLSRSINDQGSLERMYRILRQRYDESPYRRPQPAAAASSQGAGAEQS
jgi:hypothetical protein